MPADTARVLVVDDDTGLLRSYSRLLSDSGLWEPLTFSGTEGAVRAVQEGGVGAAVVDAFLGRGTFGADLISAIRAVPEGANLPIAAVSGFGSEALWRCRASGADVCREKPFGKRELLGTISDALQERRETEAQRGARVLVVDDDPEVSEFLQAVLKQAPPRYQVELACTAREALRRIRTAPPQLVVLDLALPGGTGIDVLRALRADEGTRRLPVLVQTASEGEALSAGCLNAGADDFVRKPFDHDDFLARVRALLRRSGWTARDAGVLSWGPLALDAAKCEGLCLGRPMSLTGLEFRLLKPLFEARGGVVLADDLIREVLGVCEPEARHAAHKTLLVHMSNLRKKLGLEKRFLLNKKGVGYFLAPLGES